MGKVDHITIVMMYYESPQMLGKQLEYWCAYSKDVSDRLRIVLVDDGSPKYPASDVMVADALPDFPVNLFRATENIIYNHSGGFNLAFTHIEDGWVLMTDMDHVMPEESLMCLLNMELDPNSVYRFSRRRMTSFEEWIPCHRHLDSIILTTDMYWKAGGFDEDFRGYCNGVSFLFRKAIERYSRQIVQLDDIYSLLFQEDVIPDSVNTLFGKKGSEYDINMDRPMYRKMMNALKSWQKPTDYIRFTWEQVL